MRKTIILTIGYPYGNFEPYLKDELSFHRDAILVSSYIGDSTVKNVEDRVEVWHSSNAFFSGNKFVMIVNALKAIRHPLFWKELVSEGIRPISVRKIIQLLSCLSKADQIRNYVKKQIHKQGNSDDEYVFYAYWMNQLALAAILLAKDFNGISISRCHGYDLYKRVENNQYVTLQQYLTNKLDYIFPISEDGKKILLPQLKKQNASKIIVSRLGTSEYGERIISKDIGNFVIVSCSNVVALKRVETIYEAVKAITDFPVKWIHFGNGPLFNDLSNRVKKEGLNNKVKLMGYQQKVDIMNFYAKNDVHLFVNVSDSEGVPVSIMEAISFGIPCLATDVGGVHEIVQNNVNGWLVSKGCTPEEIAEKINVIRNMPFADYLKMRKKARRLWREWYCAESNYTKIIEQIGELKNENRTIG